jgi:hypothetical protein
MKAYILYRPNSEHETKVNDFVRDFTRFTQNNINQISLDTVEGADKAKLYDVTQYPAVIATDESGVLQRLWQGDLPLMNELSYFTHD